MVQIQQMAGFRIRFFLYSAALVSLLLVDCGCSRSYGQTSSPADQPASKAQGDESFTSEAYIRLGLPAHDRDWSGDDMDNAHKVLASLAQKGYPLLPRYKSERSGEMFARLTSAQNLELFKNRAVPHAARLPQALKYYQAYNEIFKLYIAGFLKNETRDSEVIEVLGAVFRATVVLFELIDELPAVQQDDPKYQARAKGLEQMRRGLASVIAGGLQTLTERQNYRNSELIRLVGYMQETYPVLVPHLLPGARTETLVRLEKFQEDPAMKDLQPGLGSLQQKVKTSVEKPGPSD